MNTHEFDAVSFITGLVFTAIGFVYLIPRDVSQIIDFFVGAGTWFWPVLFLAGGLAVLVPALMTSRGKTEDQGPKE